MAFDNTLPHAYMGYNAMIIIPTSSAISGVIGLADIRIRATSFGVQMKQEISYPELIDSLIDKSVYKPEMETVEGDIGFPLIHEGPALDAWLPASKSGTGSGCGQGIASSMASMVWKLAATRDLYGRMAYSFPHSSCLSRQHPDHLWWLHD